MIIRYAGQRKTSLGDVYEEGTGVFNGEYRNHSGDHTGSGAGGR